MRVAKARGHSRVLHILAPEAVEVVVKSCDETTPLVESAAPLAAIA